MCVCGCKWKFGKILIHRTTLIRWDNSIQTVYTASRTSNETNRTYFPHTHIHTHSHTHSYTHKSDDIELFPFVGNKITFKTIDVVAMPWQNNQALKSPRNKAERLNEHTHTQTEPPIWIFQYRLVSHAFSAKLLPFTALLVFELLFHINHCWSIGIQFNYARRFKLGKSVEMVCVH